MQIKRVEDQFGRPVLFKRSWNYEGHESLSNDEKNQRAEHAVAAEGQLYVNGLRGEGVIVEFDHAQLVRDENEKSDTHQDMTGVRTSSASGTGVGYVFVRVP